MTEMPDMLLRQVEEMDYRTLVSLRKRVDELLVAKHREIRDQLKKKFAEEAEMYGMKLSDLVSDRRIPQRINAKIKYRHPDNELLTWTGIGRKPYWLKRLVSLGFDENQFLVMDDQDIKD